MMDDLEFRRRCYANPQDEAADFVEKQQVDSDAAQLAEELKQLDKQVHSALQVPVPTGLAERITLNPTLQKRQRYMRQRRWTMALAACLILGIGLVSWQAWQWSHPQLSNSELSDIVLRQVYQEPQALLATGEVTPERIQSLLAHFGGQLQQELPDVSYASLCIMHNQLGVHLVLQGQQGKVTVLLIPELSVRHAALVQDKYLAGLILPMRRGGMAVIGEKTEPLQLVATQVQQSIQFN